MLDNKLARYLSVFLVGNCCTTSHCMSVVNIIAAGLTAYYTYRSLDL